MERRWRLIGLPPGNTPMIAGPSLADEEEVEVVPASEVERLKEALEKIAESQAGRHEGYIYDIAREALNVRDC